MVFLSRRASDRRVGAAPHPLFAATLGQVPEQTRWAASCRAEFRTRGAGNLFGLLHHDGAILRFTTWGGSERFVGAPMEFQWSQPDDGEFRIVIRGQTCRFMDLRPLAEIVDELPAFAAPRGEPLDEQLANWMRSWAPLPATPLASRM